MCRKQFIRRNKRFGAMMFYMRGTVIIEHKKTTRDFVFAPDFRVVSGHGTCNFGSTFDVLYM